MDAQSCIAEQVDVSFGMTQQQLLILTESLFEQYVQQFNQETLLPDHHQGPKYNLFFFSSVQ